jgi:hypothetical protein
MALVIGCGLAAGLIYYKRRNIIKGILEKYSDYRECQKKQEEITNTLKYKDAPKEKIISCKYYDIVPNEFVYDRTIERRSNNSKICKLTFKELEFYAFTKNYDLRDSYLEYIDNEENTENTIITHLNKITNAKPQLLSATATIKIKSHNMDLIPEFDILNLLNKFSFNGNSLYLTDVNKVNMLAFFNTECNLNLEIEPFLMDKDTENLMPENLDLEVLYQIITNNADIYMGTNLILKFDEFNVLTVDNGVKEI